MIDSNLLDFFSSSFSRSRSHSFVWLIHAPHVCARENIFPLPLNQKVKDSTCFNHQNMLHKHTHIVRSYVVWVLKRILFRVGNNGNIIISIRLGLLTGFPKKKSDVLIYSTLDMLYALGYVIMNI